MRRIIAGAAGLAVLGGVALTGCTPGYAQETYCVNQVGQVLPDYDCQPGHVGYSPLFYYMLGTFHGHSYHAGMVIPRSYVRTSTKVIPTDRAARAKAGLPSTGLIKSGYTPRVSTPAKPQTSSTVGKTSTTVKSKTSTFGTVKSRVTSGFKSTFGGRSSFSGRSSFGGRK